MLNSVNWKSVYRSGDQNLINEFYSPALRYANSYDRGVGYFSSGVLIANLQGIASLLANGGKMRLIIGHPLDEDEYEAVKHGSALRKVQDDLSTRLEEIIHESKKVNTNRLEVLAWMIAENKLEIKYALRLRGMYHEKIGIIRDVAGNSLVYEGSANETQYALDEGFNAEVLMVFRSWDEASFRDYGEPLISGFESLWQGRQANTITLEMPSEQYQLIHRKLITEARPNEQFEIDNNNYYDRFFIQYERSPEVPATLNGKELVLHDHQKKAIRAWWGSEFKGIFQLATGSGKTLTSLVAATKVYEANKRLVLVIAVPYKELARQWVEVMKKFNMNPIKCWGVRSSWEDDLSKSIVLFNLLKRDFLSIVVVNKTLRSPHFREMVEGFDSDDLMLIGDECHNLGSALNSAALPTARFRIGLSATPFNDDEEELESPFPNDARNRLLLYFGEIVHTYSIEDAIYDGVLCEYDYYVVPVYLAGHEQERFEKLSAEIAQMIAQSQLGLSSSQRKRLGAKCGERSRLLGAAEDKFTKLEALLSKFEVNERKHSLFYCGSGAMRDGNPPITNRS